MQRKRLRIVKIIRETQDAATFVLEPVDGSGITYKAGQYLTFIFNSPTGEHRRNYSLSSSPDWNESPAITIKRIPNGNYSRLLVEKAREGDLLTTIGANGFFTLPENMNNCRQLFLLAAGSGITPVYSLIKTVLHRHPHTAITLIYSNHSKADAIFYQPLRDLERRYTGRLQIEWLFSNAPDYTRARLGNWLLGELLKKHLKVPIGECLFYLCGPYKYMLVMNITLISAGAHQSQIRKEEFVILEPPLTTPPPDTLPRQVRVILDQRKYEFTSAWPETILQSAKKQGLELPYSCEVGRCGACAALCTNGHVWMKYNEVLTAGDLEKGRVLTCTGYPVGGDVWLDFDKRFEG